MKPVLNIVIAFLALFGNFEISAKLKTFLTVEDGLSHNEVTAIVQDDEGFIWVGTRGGLNKFDGYEFQVYNQIPGDANSLVNPSIECLFIDSKGNIWIGTKSGGVSKFNPTTGLFTNIINNYKQKSELLSARRVLSFYEDEEGRIWIGTWNNGLFIYNQESKIVKHYLCKSRINTMVGTTEHRIFVGTHDSENYGLLEYDEKQDSFIVMIEGNCRKIVYDEARNVLWTVGGDNIGSALDQSGLTRFDLRNGKTTNYRIENTEIYSANLPHNYYSLHKDHEGKIWIGTWGTGLYFFEPETEKFEKYSVYPQKRRNRNRDYDAILDIFEDNYNNIWLGTNGGGLCTLSDELGFNSVGYNPNIKKGLLNTRVMSVLESKSGDLWIGTVGNGLVWSKDRKNFTQVAVPSLKNKHRFFVIKYLFEDKEGQIWAGTNLGTFQVRFKNKIPKLIPLLQQVNNQAFKRTAVSFLEDEDILYLGTLQKGLYLIDKKSLKTIREYAVNGDASGKLRSNRISYLFQDSRDRIWMGTYNGLHIFDKENQNITIAEDRYKIEGGFTGNIITCLDEDQKGNLWIGTPNGLNMLEQTAEDRFSVTIFAEGSSGLSSSFIKGIQHDNKGNIWISTNDGISKYDVKKETFINFGEADGVLGSNFTEASSYKNARGEMFFGGTSGLTYFNPDDIVEQNRALKPVFTALSVLNKKVNIGEKYNRELILAKSLSQTEKIELSYKQNKIEVEFSALDFGAHGKNQYKYKLENLDENWNNIGERRFVVFNNLSPGEYTLKVKSANRHNVWNKQVSQLVIKIHPPFWRTWYALVFYVLIALGIVVIIRSNAIRQTNLTNKLDLKQLQVEQAKEISDLKIRFYTNIFHEFRTPLTLILAPLREIVTNKEKFQLSPILIQKLAVVQNNSLRLMKLVNQLLDFRKVETGNMQILASQTDIVDFVYEVCQPFKELAQINHIQFKTSSSLTTKEIWFDRDKMEIILNNLISNAFKYVKENGAVDVSLYEEEDEVLISISDNGPGIPAYDLPYIFDRFYMGSERKNRQSSGIGLDFSKRLIDLHKGTISVTSEPDINTEFVVSLLKGKNHFSEEQIIDHLEKKTNFVKGEKPLYSLSPSASKSTVKHDTNILIVEDNDEVLSYLKELLEPLYGVETAVNGKEGLRKIKLSAPDLIISDVMMPEMDGLEFCRNVKSMKAVSTVPFIFLTAKSNEQNKLLSMQLGANDVVSKPFDPNFLLEKIKNVLNRHEQLKEKFSKSVRIEPTDIEVSSGEEAFIEKVISIIEDNLQNDNFSSEVLASLVNRSYSSLYRKLKRLTGFSTAEFIRIIRIKRAAQLLVDKEKTITEIAYEVGFNDVKHFRTVFQKHHGNSPSEYRKTIN